MKDENNDVLLVICMYVLYRYHRYSGLGERSVIIWSTFVDCFFELTYAQFSVQSFPCGGLECFYSYTLSAV